MSLAMRSVLTFDEILTQKKDIYMQELYLS